MKIKFILTSIVTCILLCSSFLSVGATHAASSYNVDFSTTSPVIDSEFEVVISLNDYSTSSQNIRGIQVDIGNINSDIFEVVSHSPIVLDSTALSNETIYLENENTVRYLYVNLNETLNKTQTSLFSLKLKVKDTAIQGTTDISVDMKIQYEGEETLAQSSVHLISYSTESNTSSESAIASPSPTQSTTPSPGPSQSPSENPDTGDESELIYFFIVAISFIGVLWILFFKKATLKIKN